MAKITVIGSSSMDLVVTAAKRPEAGETILGEDFKSVPGGKGANQAVAAGRLGADVYMVGCVGDDPYGKAIVSNLQANGVHTDYVKPVPDTASGTAHIILAEGDNSIIVVQGANKLVTPDLITDALPIIRESAMVLIQQEIPEDSVEHVSKLCKEYGIPLLLNPAPARKVRESVLSNASYLTPNETEARLIFGETSIKQALKANPNKLFVTEGKNGVRYHDGEIENVIPSFPVEALDTTGAGDTFNAAFAVALSEGKSLPESIRFANKAASISVTKFGAQGGMPSRDEVERGLLDEEKRNS
ncbi:ribokinase [Metabacillus sp. KIGAM252]|uniref:Ribokinase n=1 Tax=Metabacillus flavus TaxID=2823519 RepID=A0ABS5LB14_9BACI|nr:ribokinase [Metabacillus flavus]MBS2967905.1 ribokinase [Metabacillus flavus]